jgi:hypothetical protein
MAAPRARAACRYRRRRGGRDCLGGRGRCCDNVGRQRLAGPFDRPVAGETIALLLAVDGLFVMIVGHVLQDRHSEALM